MLNWKRIRPQWFIILLVLIESVFCNPVKLHNPEIIIHVNTIVNGTWTAGKNFEDESRDISSLFGTKIIYYNAEKKLRPSTRFAKIPVSFDAREKWGKLCPSIDKILDQGSCSAAWAFSAISVMTDRKCIASHGKHKELLSPQDLITCCSYCGGCDGGFPQLAWTYWQTHGIPTGGSFNDTKLCVPYSFFNCDHYVKGKHGSCHDTPMTPKCKPKCTHQSKRNYHKDLKYGGKVETFKGEFEMQETISKYGPIQCSFRVFEDFLHYKKGVYQHIKGSYVADLSVKVLGWGIEMNVSYWLAANSWNEDWGDGGYFKILRGNNHLNLEQECYASIPK